VLPSLGLTPGRTRCPTSTSPPATTRTPGPHVPRALFTALRVGVVHPCRKDALLVGLRFQAQLR
jgi:hypothetical protein